MWNVTIQHHIIHLLTVFMWNVTIQHHIIHLLTVFMWNVNIQHHIIHLLTVFMWNVTMQHHIIHLLQREHWMRDPNSRNISLLNGARGGPACQGTELQTGRSQVQFPMVSLSFL
jgi:hypothetical protein